MTDEEILCAFMEPRPTQGPFDFHPWRRVSPGEWWVAVEGKQPPCNPDNWPNEWQPIHITLNECHEIEARLTPELRNDYDAALRERLMDDEGSGRTHNGHLYRWHAITDQKIAALARVIGKESR